MGVLGVAALTLLADQGHASQAPLAPLSVAADAVHLGGAAIWIGGLPCLLAVLLRAPRVLPEGGRTLASATLRRFSKIALWSVVVISVTGLARMAGELSSPAAAVEHRLRPRPDAQGLAAAPDPAPRAAQPPLCGRARRRPDAERGAAAVRGPQSLQMELAIGAGIIVVAALLVAQIPGRA